MEEILTKTQFQSKLYHLSSYNQIFMSFPWVQWNFMPSAWHSQVKKKQRSFNSYGVPESDSPPHIFFGIRPQSLGKWQTALELELITFEILAAEQLRLIGFDNWLIIDCFANVVNILIWLFSTNDRLRSAKYESNYLENPFPEIKGVNLLLKTHRNDKSNVKLKIVRKKRLHFDIFS